MTSTHSAKTEAHGPGGHHHRDVSGGWLRPAVFGAMDGLVTNVSLISGVGGSGVRTHFIILTGLAGLAVGPARWRPASSSRSRRRTSWSALRCTRKSLELANNPVAEQRELAATFRAGASMPTWPGRWRRRSRRTRTTR